MTDPVGSARAVRHVGRALCAALATAMTTAAVDIVATPAARWWPYAWPVPWYLTGVSAVAWALLRAREKAATRPPEGGDEQARQDDWRTAA
ncbi:hypothetical protein ACYF6T_22345 [Streptomyces sp. 7R007]